jgi:hypothetical protein
MKLRASFVAVGASLFVAAGAAGQDPPFPPPLPPPPPTTPPPTLITGGGSCRLGEHAGIDDADAQTAAQLVCNEIARIGPPPGVRYHVALGKLGTVIIYSVTREGDTPDSVVDERELRLHGIEEASVAAPRLAESIVHRTPIAETEKFDNIVGEESRRPTKKPGSVHFSLGLLGNLPPLDQGIGPAPGLDLHVHYETKSFELGGGLRFGGGQVNRTSPTMAFFMAEVGGRYFFSDADFSPYLGGGFAWDVLSLTIPGGFSGTNAGLGSYFDVGVEFLRTYHTHLSAGFRADVPFFSLNSSEYNNCDNNGSGAFVACSAPTYYYWPLSIEVRLTF